MGEAISVPLSIKDNSVYQVLLQIAQKLNSEVADELLPTAYLTNAHIGDTVQPYDPTTLVSGTIGVTVQGYDATILKDSDLNVTVQPFDPSIVKSGDIGTIVQSFDASTLKSANIGVDVPPINDASMTGTLTTTQLLVSSPSVPATASDTGVAGQIEWDSSYIYVCTATDTWKRTALSTW